MSGGHRRWCQHCLQLQEFAHSEGKYVSLHDKVKCCLYRVRYYPVWGGFFQHDVRMDFDCIAISVRECQCCGKKCRLGVKSCTMLYTDLFACSREGTNSWARFTAKYASTKEVVVALMALLPPLLRGRWWNRDNHDQTEAADEIVDFFVLLDIGGFAEESNGVELGTSRILRSLGFGGTENKSPEGVTERRSPVGVAETKSSEGAETKPSEGPSTRSSPLKLESNKSTSSDWVMEAGCEAVVECALVVGAVPWLRLRKAEWFRLRRLVWRPNRLIRFVCRLESE